MAYLKFDVHTYSLMGEPQNLRKNTASVAVSSAIPHVYRPPLSEHIRRACIMSMQASIEPPEGSNGLRGGMYGGEFRQVAAHQAPASTARECLHSTHPFLSDCQAELALPD